MEKVVWSLSLNSFQPTEGDKLKYGGESFYLGQQEYSQGRFSLKKKKQLVTESREEQLSPRKDQV